MDSNTASQIFSRLSSSYPHTETHFLHFQDPFQCLILTILSAQTTDATVNKVAPSLFARFPTPASLACADLLEVERIIHRTGFYHAKARHITGAAAALVERFDGVVPDSMADLLTIPGVGRKTANIVLNHAFGIDEGIAVDTHVRRLAQRIGFSDSANPDKIEQDLIELFPRSRWGEITFLLIRHGREICPARKPQCGACQIRDLCRFALSKEEEG